jgi:hypothetical protein
MHTIPHLEAPHDVMITSDSNIDLNVALLNDIVMLMCISSGGPNKTYEWAKDETILDGETSDTLALTVANGSSGGIYTCTVSNAAGNDSASTTLYVAPYIVTPLEEQTLTFNGSSINLTCEADGFPLPTVSWDRNTTGVAISNDSELIIPTVTFGQEGVYRCLANVTINGVEYEDSDITNVIGEDDCYRYGFNLYKNNTLDT